MESLLNFSFIQSKLVYSLFIKIINDDDLMALLVYVDDIVIRSSSMKATADVKNYLSSKLKLKDLGSPKYFIGLEIAKLKEGICISQRKYTLDMLEDYCLLGLKPISTPIDYNHKLSQAIDVDVLSNAIKYKQLVGK